jgi:hypothetical protein
MGDIRDQRAPTRKATPNTCRSSEDVSECPSPIDAVLKHGDWINGDSPVYIHTADSHVRYGGRVAINRSVWNTPGWRIARGELKRAGGTN